MKYPKDVILKNSKHVQIRPYSPEDEENLKRFYMSIPEKERWFIPYDMMKPEMQCEWSEHGGKECLYSIIATSEDQIIAHGNLHEGAEGPYTRHVGKLRLKVSPSFRGQRLGTWMVLDLIKLAIERGLLDLRIDLIMGIDATVIDGLYKLDFFQRATLEDYAIDSEGNRHDMIVMMKRLHKDYGDF